MKVVYKDFTRLKTALILHLLRTYSSPLKYREFKNQPTVPVP
jgi:hypothetical protein